MFFKAPIVTAWSWAGPYLGLNIGYSIGRSKTDAGFSDATLDIPLFAAGSSDNLKGLIGGVQAGYNWQAGNWVAGVEAQLWTGRCCAFACTRRGWAWTWCWLWAQSHHFLGSIAARSSPTENRIPAPLAAPHRHP